jgi:release factor glutamine methyltransferase
MSLNKPQPTIQTIRENSALTNLDQEVLLAWLLKSSREFVLTHPETKLSELVQKKFQQLELKRLNNWPLAYLTGSKAFYNLNFKVSPAVLTPRPETEELVDHALTAIKNSSVRRLAIIDLGTGSGAIICSLAQTLTMLHGSLADYDFYAVDISAAALKLARTNAKNFHLTPKIKFILGDLLQPLSQQLFTENYEEIIITANLPYLTPTQITAAPSISREPRLALDGGPDGLRYYRRLFRQLKALKLKSSLQILCEIDPSSAEKLPALLPTYFSNFSYQAQRDLSGHIRFINITIN